MIINYLYIISLFICLPFFSLGERKDNNTRHAVTNADIEQVVDSLGTACWKLRETHSDSSLTLGLKALELANKHQLNAEISRISNYVGVVYLHYKYKFRESISYFQKAMRISLTMKDSVQLAYAYNNLGDVYLLSGNIPLAIQYGQFSFDIFKKLGNEVGMAYGYMNLGEVYREKRDYKKSLEYFEAAFAIREVMSSSTKMGFVLYNRAKTLEESGNLEEAMSFYQQSLECSYDSDDFRYVSWSLNGIANNYYTQGKYDSSLEYYQKALDWNKDRNHEYGLIDNYIGLALVYAQLKEAREGEILLNKALELASRLELNSQIIKSYNSYFKFYKILGDYENVTRSFDIFFMKYDSLLSAQQFEIVNELERNFAVQQNLIKTEQALERDKLYKERLVAIILLMVVVIVVLIWQYRSYKRMNKRLEEINQTKDKLFSVISHDLRNPFNNLIGFSEVLQTELDNNNYEQAKEIAGYLNRSSVEGYDLLTNLLNWSLSQSGKIQFSPKHLNFNELFKELEELYHTQIDNYKVNLTFENKISNLISADKNILKIILTNLITNAFKYTKENGTIRVFTAQENTLVKICVEDTGIGMSKETVNKLFDKNSFVKSKQGLRTEKGTGLGLSIVNDLVQIHNGEIKVRSQEGKGTTFEILFFTDSLL